MLAKFIALVVHEVVTEYRKLDHECRCEPERGYDVASTTAAETERPGGWDHDKRVPATAADVRFGFGSRS
jgi:hypothetical protein